MQVISNFNAVVLLVINIDGRCEEACAGGRTLCQDECVDTSSDARHCGECGQACESGQVGGTPGDGQTSVVVATPDYPAIAFEDSRDDSVNYAGWTGSSWSWQEVDSSGFLFGTRVLAYDGDYNRHLAFSDLTGLKYGLREAGDWTVEYVMEGYLATVGQSISLAVDANNRPHVAYTDFGLKYARLEATGWSIQTVDAPGSRASGISIAVDAANNPHVAYYIGGDDDTIRYAHWNGTAWEIDVLVDGLDNGLYYVFWMSMALDSTGTPHVSYYDSTADNLMYISLSNP